MIYDIIIIGLGPAGIGAAVYAKRSGLNILGIEKNMPGGYVNYIDTIENYIGEPTIAGADLAIKFYQQLKANEIEFKTQNVTAIRIENDLKVVVTDKEEFRAKNVIVATGNRPKRLNLENEAKLLGKGISTCALCDGPFYKGRDVAVIGGGNSALAEAIYLSKICRKIYLIHRRDHFTGDAALVEKAAKITNIEVIFNSNLTKIVEKETKLGSVILNTGREIEVAGLFIYIGFFPATNFLTGLDILDENGYIIVNENFEAKIPGLYAAGDVIKKEAYQIIPAVNDGILAAIHISKNI